MIAGVEAALAGEKPERPKPPVKPAATRTARHRGDPRTARARRHPRRRRAPCRLLFAEAVRPGTGEALTVVGPGRPAAWRTIDEKLAGEDAFIPLYTAFSYPQTFSGRAGCQVFLPLYGGLVDLGSLCLR